MLRLWTYVNVDADGDPSASGTYFEIPIYTLRVQMGQNTYIQPVRDGTEIFVDDPQPMHPVRINLQLLMADIDLKSESAYMGLHRYLGPVLYFHKMEHMWVALFTQSDQETSRKCYLCRLLEVDQVLAGCSTINTDEMTYGPQEEVGGAPMLFTLYVDRSGVFTDYDDVTSGTYIRREPTS